MAASCAESQTDIQISGTLRRNMKSRVTQCMNNGSSNKEIHLGIIVLCNHYSVVVCIWKYFSG